MYLEYFGLKSNPFSLASDASCVYYSHGHCEAMAHLLYGVRERKGLVLLLGEAGTGKTTMVRATLDLLRSTRVLCSVIFNPLLENAQELLEAVLAGFGMDGDGATRSPMAMMATLQRFLQQQAGSGLIPALVVDEAQQLSRGTLEHLRLLSNLESNGQKLLQIIFSAQPEMGDLLADPKLAALRQRIVVRCRLERLTLEEVWLYLATRVAYAGGDGRLIFSPGAANLITQYSSGIPRVINIIADNCLLAAYAQSSAVVEPNLVTKVATHLELPSPTASVRSYVLFGSAAGNRPLSTDMMRASTSWKEIAGDVRKSRAPEALLRFVDALRAPQEGFPAEKAWLSEAQSARRAEMAAEALR